MGSSAGQRHQIMRQVLEVGGCASSEAPQVLSDLRGICYRRLIPIIETTCSALSAPDRVHRVNVLEIDLGELPLDRIEIAVADAFAPAFARTLAEALATNESEVMDAELVLITYFIHTGMVPWWADRSDRHLLDANLEVLIARAPDALRDAIENAAVDSTVWRRIARAFPDRLLDALAGILFPSRSAIEPGAGMQWLPLLTEVTRACGHPGSIGRHFWWEELLRTSSVAAPRVSDAPHVLAGIFLRLAQRLEVEDDAFVGSLHAAVNRMDIALPADMAPSPRMRDVVDAMSRDVRNRGVLGGSVEAAWRNSKSTDGDIASVRTSGVQGRPAYAAWRFSDADEIYVDNAGLVLLWPFVERFLARLGLIDARQFRDETARQRAVGLLQYLATEEAAAPEFLVPLNKVLCGMPFDEVFDFGAPIADAEIEACDELLTAAIQHAPILHDMSIAGFRSSFLLREGQLSARDGCWLLRVQRETHDIVTDHFPWSARVIKLPWMETMVVEW